MKTTFAFLALSLIALGASVSTSKAPAGEVVAKYSGDFSVTPTVMHKSKISGKIAFGYTDADLTAVSVTLDLPVLGKTAFSSKEQFAVTAQPNGGFQYNSAWKFNGPTHKWYFVFVGNSVDNGQTVTGSIYRVDDTLDNLKAILTAGVTDAPATWKKLSDNNILKAAQ